MNNLKVNLRKLYDKYIIKNRNEKEITYSEAKEILKKNKNSILLDVRSEQEYNEYHLNNSINIPLYSLNDRVELELKNKDDIIIVYCQTGARSKKAQKKLKDLGYNNIYNMKGRNKLDLMPKIY